MENVWGKRPRIIVPSSAERKNEQILMAYTTIIIITTITTNRKEAITIIIFIIVCVYSLIMSNCTCIYAIYICTNKSCWETGQHKQNTIIWKNIHIHTLMGRSFSSIFLVNVDVWSKSLLFVDDYCLQIC